MNDFAVHWSRVRGACAAPFETSGRALCAVWPAPVNADECFAAAGCDHIGEQDPHWDGRAADLLARLTGELSRYGAPRLVSPPLHRHVPWYARLFRTGDPLPLQEQLLQPIHWDSLPRGRIAFGAGGTELIAGDGHHIYWFTLPLDQSTGLADRVASIAAGWPTVETELRWEHLLPGALT